MSASEGPGAILVQLEDTQKPIHVLLVEDIRKVPDFDFSQIVVKLPDAIETGRRLPREPHVPRHDGNKPFIRILR